MASAFSIDQKVAVSMPARDAYAARAKGGGRSIQAGRLTSRDRGPRRYSSRPCTCAGGAVASIAVKGSLIV